MVGHNVASIVVTAASYVNAKSNKPLNSTAHNVLETPTKQGVATSNAVSFLISPRCIYTRSLPDIRRGYTLLRRLNDVQMMFF